MTISKLTPKRAKKVALNLTVLIEKAKVFSDMQEEAKGKQGAELEEAGLNILNKFLDFAFQQEYDLIIGIIADLFDMSFEAAEELPLESIYDFVVKDRALRTFFPQLAILEARAQSDILPNVMI